MSRRIAQLSIADAFNARVALAMCERSLATINRAFELLLTERI